MPGEASLAAGQYYAHPRNHFWRIVGTLTEAGPERPYQERLQALTARRIALWDVLESCCRTGSLDSAITNERANDFPEFFRHHPHIRAVFFNGGKAERAFRTTVLPALEAPVPALRRLPSTSPANASYSFERKCAAWQEIAAFLDP
jgi:hypoxanthine-DNA glycosylase